MSTTCEINFETSRLLKVYSAGQLLRGNVRLVLEEEIKIRGVYVRIWGRAYAKVRSGKHTYTDKEDYLNEKTYFVGGEHGEVRLSPGEYFYNFECMLPAELPTSCEGKIGYIRYSVNVILDIPIWPDKTFEEPFTVIKAVDLNSVPAYREPNLVQRDHKFWPRCCCCPSNPVRIIARTPVRGYTPGQTVNLDLQVNNKSMQQIHKFTVKLIKEIKYCVTVRRCCCPVRIKRDETVTISKKYTTGCNASQEEFIRVNFVIPPLPPTDVTTSSIMKVQYYLKIIGSASFFHLNPTVRLPITIGTYPIQDNAAAPTTSNAGTNDQSGSIGTSSASFKNDDPPTYEEAIYLNDTDANGYKPLYPVFKQQTSY